MKRFLTLFLFVVTLSGATAQATLSERAVISVVTCGPFQGEVYTAFGHSAFRVQDPAQGIDWIFNYGIFNFNQPHFYLNFTRGNLLYELGVQDYEQFKATYIYYNRFIHEQPLNLTAAQNQKLFEFLVDNAQPDKKQYRYDYFYNNCATKIRDVVSHVLGDSVTFDGSYIKTDYTIRDLTDLYLTQQPWGDLGIDICLGLPMDKHAAPIEYMFLPDYVESGFNHATIKHGDKVEPLVLRTESVYEARAEEVHGPPHPLFVLSGFALIALALTAFDLRRKKLSNWFDVILFGVTGLLGLLFLVLWVATDHKAAANNLNLLWALPTNLVAVIAFIRAPKWLATYFLVVSVISAMLLITWAILPQHVNTALIPFVIALMVRAALQYIIRRQGKA